VRHSLSTISTLSADPAFRHVMGVSAVFLFAVVVNRVDDIAYIEWPETEPIANVLSTMQWAERVYSVVFDADDPNLLERVSGGFRLHGMFMEHLIGEETA